MDTSHFRRFTPEILEPVWLPGFLSGVDEVIPEAADRLRLTFALAERNVRHRTGGPFAAAIFERKTHRLYAVGLNRVVPAAQSFAHAEMTAIAQAQLRFGSFDLHSGDFELVSSCEPCVMCFGGTLWSGVTALLYGAAKHDAEAVGFDEGDKVADWHESLERRGISVTGPMLPDEAIIPFAIYRELDGKIY